ncbi:MAG: transglutaminase domain-containing protein, partial [Planctomycetota bacterium]
CYHFAVLHCAFLRAKGVPSRARCGFAAYYRKGAWIDHWIVEYWDHDDWVLIDPDSARDVVSPNDFHHAGRAWQLCRAGSEDPSRHGNHELWGWDELRGSLIADVGSLNKVEVGDWETWCAWIGIEQKEQPNAELDTYLDTIAEMVSDDGAFEELQRVFREDDRLRPPAAATSGAPV